jgi:putative transposase
MGEASSPPARSRWARFRFGVVAPLLTAPPKPGELASSIATLAARSWPHPTTGEAFQISAKTIERWARDAEQPIEALARKVPSHAGSHPKITALVIHELGD